MRFRINKDDIKVKEAIIVTFELAYGNRRYSHEHFEDVANDNSSRMYLLV